MRDPNTEEYSTEREPEDWELDALEEEPPENWDQDYGEEDALTWGGVACEDWDKAGYEDLWEVALGN
jgi:hypothetical protein